MHNIDIYLHSSAKVMTVFLSLGMNTNELISVLQNIKGWQDLYVDLLLRKFGLSQSLDSADKTR